MNATGEPLSKQRVSLVEVFGALLILFTLVEVNYPLLRPQSQLALFALFGLLIVFLDRRSASAGFRGRLRVVLDPVLALASVAVCGWMVVQTEPLFEGLWIDGVSLGDRAGAEQPVDLIIGAVGLLLVVEAARRTVGWALPVLAGVFVLYARFGPSLPDWLFPHRGYGWERIVSQTFLHSQGVFGTALKVMFTYVFLFVFFGALLERTGATAFVIDAARRLFANSPGGAAKVSVLSSGLMGSLSGSAVANTATTGTFTIPLMRSGGFSRHVAAGVEAAASSGGALVPPVMGAGAYMMLEIVDPPVTYLQIVRAALIPALLYYLSLFAIVHFVAQRIHARSPVDGVGPGAPNDEEEPLEQFEGADAGRYAGVLFGGSLALLVLLLGLRFSVFRAVSVAVAGVLVLAMANPKTRLGLRDLFVVAGRTARASVSLIAAAASVGIVIGVVTLTGVGTKLPSMLLPLAEQNLMAALALIMVSSIVLGMGLPSAVCYLLMATLIGPVLGDLGVVPLAAHLFIFYFGMMSMVTPPVALAAYTAASISGSKIMRTALAAFRFALAGFTLPYLFVLRPELLLMTADGSPLPPLRVVVSVVVAVVGIVALAAAIAGWLRGWLNHPLRLVALASAALLLWPAPTGQMVAWNHAVGFVVFAALAALRRPAPG